MKVGLITCGKAKRGAACAAKDLYTGLFFRLGRRLLEETTDEWAVLSARYGLLLPDTVVEPYELVIRATGLIKKSPHTEMTPEQRGAWYSSTNSALKARWPGASFVALVSKSYLPALAGLDYSLPLEGRKMFERNSELKRLLAAGEGQGDLWTR